jgi:hypothetical protein
VLIIVFIKSGVSSLHKEGHFNVLATVEVVDVSFSVAHEQLEIWYFDLLNIFSDTLLLINEIPDPLHCTRWWEKVCNC